MHGEDRPVAHFLHIGKTAGTALKAALSEAPPSDRFDVQVHPHEVRMADLPVVDRFFFSVRDPVSRFVSGFLSRQRQGRPAHVSPWRDAERIAFSRFSTPEDLAVALGPGAPGDERRREAVEAMKSIEHVNQSYWYWFDDEAHLRARASRILWIGRQETIEADLPLLTRELGVGELILPVEVERAHRAPMGSTRELSEEARSNIYNWYKRDYEFLAFCERLRADLVDSA